MARSLLRQLEQIRRSATYDDAIADFNTSAVAEPTVSGSLEDDLNVIRSIIKQIKSGDTGNWYDDPGMYFDPTNAGVSGITDSKQMSLANIKGHTLDAKTIILAVADDNSGSGYTVSGTSDGFLMSTTVRYATTSGNITGLPIYASTANNGTYKDEGEYNRIVRIDVIDTSTDGEFETPGGNTIFAKFHDGADFSGSGDGTDVYVRFYEDDGSTYGSETTLSGTSVTNVKLVYPRRRRMSDMSEWEWLRTDFVSSWEGDIELIEDISNLWSFTGAGDDVTAPTWTDTGSSYLLAGGENLNQAADALNTGIGDLDFSASNYLTAVSTVAGGLSALDSALNDVEDAVTAGVGEKYVESLSAPVTKNTLHDLPYGITYTPSSGTGREGKNMDVYVDGQLLAADTGLNGVNADRDYGETTISGITFRFDLQIGRNITYIVRQ